MSYADTIIAISEVLSDQHLRDIDEPMPSSDAIAAEIIACQQNLPDYLSLPMRILTWCFGLSSLPGNWCTFHRLDLSRQFAQLQYWRNSKFGVCRNFVRFYESLFLLAALQEGGTQESKQ